MTTTTSASTKALLALLAGQKTDEIKANPLTFVTLCATNRFKFMQALAAQPRANHAGQVAASQELRGFGSPINQRTYPPETLAEQKRAEEQYAGHPDRAFLLCLDIDTSGLVQIRPPAETVAAQPVLPAPFRATPAVHQPVEVVCAACQRRTDAPRYRHIVCSMNPWMPLCIGCFKQTGFADW